MSRLQPEQPEAVLRVHGVGQELGKQQASKSNFTTVTRKT